jgi:hypothetical protein
VGHRPGTTETIVRVGTLTVEELNIFSCEAGKPGCPILVLPRGFPALSDQYCAGDKIRIVLAGLCGENIIGELRRKESINQNLYYRWSRDILEAGSSPTSPRNGDQNGNPGQLVASVETLVVRAAIDHT